MNGIAHILPALAGLGIFLFGMHQLEASLKKLAGRAFRLFLRRQTGTPLRATFAGALVTAVLQSSSLVTLLVMSFAGAGIIGLAAGMAMIMGANVGTTATGWLVSQLGFGFGMDKFMLPFLFVGGLGAAFFKREKPAAVCRFLVGIGLLFLGLSYIKDGFMGMANLIDLSTYRHSSPLLFLLPGLLLTMLIQSSSASMTIYLSSLAAGIITLPQAACLAIGSDVGTTITGIIGTFSGNALRKKVGWWQFMFNVVTASVALLCFKPLLYIVQKMLGPENPLTSLVAFHSLFNIMGVIVVFPFIGFFKSLLDKIVPDSNGHRLARHLLAGGGESISGVIMLEKECADFIARVMEFNTACFSDGQAGQTLMQQYDLVKQHENEIIEFYLPLLEKELEHKETAGIMAFTNAVRNAGLSAKDLKDIQHNLSAVEASVSDDSSKLLHSIREMQLAFYGSLKQLMAAPTAAFPDELLTGLKSNLQAEAARLYRLSYNNESGLDLASGMNMLHEIERSDELLAAAIATYGQHTVGK